jgi:hypothetical protein
LRWLDALAALPGDPVDAGAIARRVAESYPELRTRPMRSA